MIIVSGLIMVLLWTSREEIQENGVPNPRAEIVEDEVEEVVDEEPEDEAIEVDSEELKKKKFIKSVEKRMKSQQKKESKGAPLLSEEELEEIDRIAEERGYSAKEKKEFKQIWVDVRETTKEFDGPDDDPNEDWEGEEE